ncbi:MAG TPA: hypothetical protein VFH83_01805 [Spirochaetia bacterium]|nr:hypothetical protein [Spirochaetia bacterium]
MKTTKLLDGLCVFIAAAGMVAATVGLFWNDGGQPFPFTTIHGSIAHQYGTGLYRFDTVLIGAGFKGQDAVVLFLGVPLLVLATVFGRTGRLRARLLQTGILAYFLYVYASMAFGAAYNTLFLLYVATFSASLFALYLAFSLTLELHSGYASRLPRLWPAVLLLASGALTALIWLVPLVTAMASGGPPMLLDGYTTMLTDALDLGIVAPLAVVAGVLTLRGSPMGFRLAFPILGLLVMLLPTIVGATVSQVGAGVAFTPGAIIGPVAGFLILGLLGLWVLVTFLLRLDQGSRR